MNRIETDSFGEIEVEEKHYFGASTQRSLEKFKIGSEKMPMELIKALALLKKCAAISNFKLGYLKDEVFKAITNAADRVLAGEFDSEFPLAVWQTGSGTQTNMNMNEVIANIANESLIGKKGTKSPVHPNDHVNMAQSSNDSFPTAMNIAVVTSAVNRLIPAMEKLEHELAKKSSDWKNATRIQLSNIV